MFSHSIFLKLGDFSTGVNFDSLLSDGYELANFEYAFQQGIDGKGKAATLVSGGTMSLIIPSLPSKEIIEWALGSRKYKEGMVAILGQEGVPQEKIIFLNTACINMTVTYSQKGKTGVVTNLILQAEELRFGKNVYFLNRWV